MEKISRAKVKELQDSHELWLSGEIVQGSKAVFSGCIIKIVNFREAKLSMADFSNSRLKVVEFVDAHLRDASFEGAELIKVDFHNADLSGANFSNCKFKKVHISEDMLQKIVPELTPIQLEGVIISYKEFMRKMIF